MTDSYWSLDGFIDALVASLRARANLSGIQVEDQWPGEELQQAKSIWVHEAKATVEVAGMRTGTINLNEDYKVGIVCDALVEGGNTKAARDTVTLLVGEVIADICEKKRYTTVDNKIVSARVSGWEYAPYVGKLGRGVAARVELRVTGRI